MHISNSAVKPFSSLQVCCVQHKNKSKSSSLSVYTTVSIASKSTFQLTMSKTDSVHATMSEKDQKDNKILTTYFQTKQKYIFVHRHTHTKKCMLMYSACKIFNTHMKWIPFLLATGFGRKGRTQFVKWGYTKKVDTDTHFTGTHCSVIIWIIE